MNADSSSEEETEQRSPKGIKLLTPDLQNIVGTDIIKTGINPKYPVVISGGRRKIFVYCDLIQDEIPGNKLTSLLRTIALPNNSTQKTQSAVICHQSFSNLQWKNVVNSSFQSTNITTRDETRQLMSFLSISQTGWNFNFYQTESMFAKSIKQINVHNGFFGSVAAHYQSKHTIQSYQVGRR